MLLRSVTMLKKSDNVCEIQFTIQFFSFPITRYSPLLCSLTLYTS